MQEPYSKPQGVFGLSIPRKALQHAVRPLGVSRASVSTCLHSKSRGSQQPRGQVAGTDLHVSVQGQSA